MPDIKTDNPPGRLLAIINAAKRSDYAAKPMLVGWGYVFGILDSENGDAITLDEEFEVSRCLLDVTELIVGIEAKIRSIADIDQELHLAPFPKFKQTFSLSSMLGGNLASNVNRITDGDITSLKHTVSGLARYYSESLVDEELLRNLKVDLDDLFDEVKGAGIPNELRAFLLRQIETMRRAVQEYWILGHDGLKSALEKILGSLAVNNDLADQALKTSVAQKFVTVFRVFNGAVTFASKIVPLIGPANTLLALMQGVDQGAIPPHGVPGSSQALVAGDPLKLD
jgi:hypothetical protein